MQVIILHLLPVEERLMFRIHVNLYEALNERRINVTIVQNWDIAILKFTNLFGKNYNLYHRNLLAGGQ